MFSGEANVCLKGKEEEDDDDVEEHESWIALSKRLPEKYSVAKKNRREPGTVALVNIFSTSSGQIGRAAVIHVSAQSLIGAQRVSAAVNG